jgi:hypothetical protein
MFREGTETSKELKNGRLSVTDIRSEVFKQLLAYLYTRRVPIFVYRKKGEFGQGFVAFRLSQC